MVHRATRPTRFVVVGDEFVLIWGAPFVGGEFVDVGAVPGGFEVGGAADEGGESFLGGGKAVVVGLECEEGAFEGMWDGTVDEEWSKQHHSVWHEREIAKGNIATPPPEGKVQPAE